MKEKKGKLRKLTTKYLYDKYNLHIEKKPIIIRIKQNG